MTKTRYGILSDGTEVSLYTLTNSRGAKLRVTPYGGIVVSLEAPDKKGDLADMVLGHDSLDAYVKNNPFFGCIVGRFGNRIKDGRFELDGKTYQLAKNDRGRHHIHGGVKGFDKILWKAEEDGNSLLLSHVSPDGDEGYPGTLKVTTHYSWSDDCVLLIEYSASTDKPTIVNLTHHSYFNLAGPGSGDVLGHELMIPAETFVPVDELLIPYGELKAVAGTPFDFNQSTAIGAHIHDSDLQLKHANGYDHNWVLRKKPDELALAAKVFEPKSGRVMELRTTAPGVQFYAGNFLDGTVVGKNGEAYAKRHGFCLEPQHYPDSPNQKTFPNTVLKAGETYRHTLSYGFSAK